MFFILFFSLPRSSLFLSLPAFFTSLMFLKMKIKIHAVHGDEDSYLPNLNLHQLRAHFLASTRKNKPHVGYVGYVGAGPGTRGLNRISNIEYRMAAMKVQSPQPQRTTDRPPPHPPPPNTNAVHAYLLFKHSLSPDMYSCFWLFLPSIGGNPSVVELFAAVGAAQKVHSPVSLHHGVEHSTPPRRLRAHLAARWATTNKSKQGKRGDSLAIGWVRREMVWLATKHLQHLHLEI